MKIPVADGRTTIVLETGRDKCSYQTAVVLRWIRGMPFYGCTRFSNYGNRWHPPLSAIPPDAPPKVVSIVNCRQCRFYESSDEDSVTKELYTFLEV